MNHSFNSLTEHGGPEPDVAARATQTKLASLMGYRLLDDSIPPLMRGGKPLLVNTMNPHSFVTAQNDDAFRDALQCSDVLVADGVGMVLASLILRGRRINRVTGADVWAALMTELASTSGKCMFVGSTPEMLTAITQRLAKSHPTVTVGVHSPPFAELFSDEQINDMAKAINAFSPDVVFLGLTAPKQEKLAHRLKNQIDVKVIACIGAVFGYVAGGSKARAPAFLRPLGLEWLYRLLREPRRLYKRTLISAPLFLWAVCLTRLGVKSQSR